MQILRDLFGQCARASELLGVDADFRAKVAAARARLAPMRVGKGGQLQEWLEDWDLEAPEPQHRHASHMYGLFPSDQITPGATPELFAAARRSLELRGDAGTGWSLAWKTALWARLGDGDRAHRLLGEFLTPVGFRGEGAEYADGGVYASLLCAHPPFQIDGNFGTTAAIAEMLVQSHRTEDGVPVIELLPALPGAWPEGEVRGLRARGGVVVERLAWSGGEVTEVALKSTCDTTVLVRGERVHLTQGQTWSVKY